MSLRLTHICPGVHRLASRYENWYLLVAGGRLTVLDAGLPGDWGEFALALSRLGHTPADIDAVLITHTTPIMRGMPSASGHLARGCSRTLRTRPIFAVRGG